MWGDFFVLIFPDPTARATAVMLSPQPSASEANTVEAQRKAQLHEQLRRQLASAGFAAPATQVPFLHCLTLKTNEINGVFELSKPKVDANYKK